MTSKLNSLGSITDTSKSLDFESEQESDFLRRFAASINADTAGLVIHKPFEDNFQIVTWRHSPDATKEYQAHYGRFDPLRKILKRNGDRFFTIDTFVEPAYQQPEWRHDYLHRYGIRHLLVTTWRDSEGHYRYLGFQRHADAQPFSNTDVAFSNRFLCGWKAEQTMLRSEAASGVDVSKIGEHILDRTGLCVVLVDGDLRVHFANQKAVQSFNSSIGIKLYNSRIGMKNALEQHLFTKQVLSAINSRVTNPVCLGTGSERWFLIISPFLVSNRPLAILLAKPANEPNDAGSYRNALSRAFDLTKAEERLTNALVGGETINEYALRIGITPTTARNQLRAVLRKTGTSRQVELVRMFCRFPDFHG